MSERGYAMAIPISPTKVHLRFAKKILVASDHRQDGLIRHELGHAVDFLIPSVELDVWASEVGRMLLPKSPERRADAIALILWLDQIRYDKDLVQSTTTGQYPRPKQLGL